MWGGGHRSPRGQPACPPGANVQPQFPTSPQPGDQQRDCGRNGFPASAAPVCRPRPGECAVSRAQCCSLPHGHGLPSGPWPWLGGPSRSHLSASFLSAPGWEMGFMMAACWPSSLPFLSCVHPGNIYLEPPPLGPTRAPLRTLSSLSRQVGARLAQPWVRVHSLSRPRLLARGLE